MKENIVPEGESHFEADGISGFSITTNSTSVYDPWSDPIRVGVVEKSDSIELIYKEISMVTYTVYPSPPPEERVFKIVYSCEDGKWHKSDRIYGKIVAPQKERYVFGQ